LWTRHTTADYPVACLSVNMSHFRSAEAWEAAVIEFRKLSFRNMSNLYRDYRRIGITNSRYTGV
jgi:hypothetical protein